MRVVTLKRAKLSSTVATAPMRERRRFRSTTSSQMLRAAPV
jgi:hypothetical protein